jgi:hypothetical protein
MRMGSMRTLHHLPTTRAEPCGFIKKPAQIYRIHMELSLRRSFQLRRNLEGYMVGTTAGF